MNEINNIYEQLPLASIGQCYNCKCVVSENDKAYLTRYEGCVHFFCEECMEFMGFLKERKKSKLPRCERCKVIIDSWCQEHGYVHEYNKQAYYRKCQGCVDTLEEKSRMRHKKFSRQQLPHVKEMLNVGVSVADISRILKIPRTTLRRWTGDLTPKTPK